jgi:MraZ protein
MHSLFLGCTLCEVDPDGTILLSDSAAQALGLPAPDEPLFLSTHERDRCLVGYARSHLDEIRTRTERWRLADEAAGRNERAHHDRMRRLFGLVETAPRIAGGLALPPAMRHLGRIESVALVVGAGDRFEIWNPQLAMASADQRFRELVTWQVARHAPRAGSRRARPLRGRSR